MEPGVPDEKITIDGDADRFDSKGDRYGMWSEGALPHAREREARRVSTGKDEVPGRVNYPCNGITSARGAPVT